MVNEKKVRDDLKVSDDAMLELNRQVPDRHAVISQPPIIHHWRARGDTRFM